MFTKVVIVKGCPHQESLVDKLRSQVSVSVEHLHHKSWITPGSLVLVGTDSKITEISSLQNASSVLTINANEDVDSIVCAVLDYFIDYGDESKVLPKTLANDESPPHERIPVTPK